MLDEAQARTQAESLLEGLRAQPRAADLKAARALTLTLRNLRAYEPMGRLAEALCRLDPADMTTRILYAQCLIERGAATVALDVLRQMMSRLGREHAEWAEAWGLIGRAHKQIFFDMARPSTVLGRRSLASAVEAYATAYKADADRNAWHGVNVLALVSMARREGWSDIAPKVVPLKLALRLMASLEGSDPERKDPWTLPSLAEVALGLSLANGELSVVEGYLRQYLQAEGLRAFMVASTLRQFTEVWGVEVLTTRSRGVVLRTAADAGRARATADILRACLLKLPGGAVTLPIPRANKATPPNAVSAGRERQLEAVLGVEGPETYRWWRAGVEAARSVAAIRKRLGNRIGTGFLVRAADLGLQGQRDELLLMTNHHVVNPAGEAPGIRPADAEVVFEAVDMTRAYAVDELIWTSPVDKHDATLLRLREMPTGVLPLGLSSRLPQLPATPSEIKRPRVYVIGYPGGRELSFSFQDNELLDHEGPPAGHPQIEGVCRVHYRAPTEGGSSGSPVFEGENWQVVALHHKGGRFGMPRLNGGAGTYAANEGIAVGPLMAALVRDVAASGVHVAADAQAVVR